ncbi:MAG TPA: DNA repair protein RecO [Candidatus Limnocylindria bacterium]|nr:DNA repair protein RecO [Candidatus Limnocylindria bacterium]
MEWNDDAIVLSARRHGETSAVVALLTREHGRHTGLARGAAKRHRGIYESGNSVRAHWRGRLSEHLGTLTCELTGAVAAQLLDDRGRLAALAAACAIADSALPDRVPCPQLYAALDSLMAQLLKEELWTRAYVAWELNLLAELGFGLDLSRCAATGRTDQLAYVSPRSGRAVSLSVGEPYRDRLLRLPLFLIMATAPSTAADVFDGLALTGYFLGRHVYGHGDYQRALPPARLRLVEGLGRNSDAGDRDT